MNCEHFSSLIGMRCEPQPTRDGSQCVAVVTPFRFFDGDGLSLFAFGLGNNTLLSDEGMTLSWLMGLGHNLSDRRAWKPLRAALESRNVQLSNEGVVEVLTPTAQAPDALARMVSGLLAIDAWAREHHGNAAAGGLHDEVAQHLRAWRPDLALIHHPDPVIGFSGSPHRFAFAMGDEYIDAIGLSKTASNAELRKLVDIRRSSVHAHLPIRVILDDRAAPDRAAVEMSILGQFAKAWPLSRLMKAASQQLAH